MNWPLIDVPIMTHNDKAQLTNAMDVDWWRFLRIERV